MTRDGFLNLLRILVSIDMDQLEQANVIGLRDRSAWQEFRHDPFRWFMRADDETAARLWCLIERRANAALGPVSLRTLHEAVAYRPLPKFKLDLDCRQCGRVTRHRHMHDCAHGIPETHMAGTERFICLECRCTTFAGDGIDGFVFILDRPEGVS